MYKKFQQQNMGNQMSCLLASAIGKGFGKMGGETLKEEDVEKCAQMITFVLLNCRHKGVIESAGGAIFSLASFCSRNSNPNLTRLPSKNAALLLFGPVVSKLVTQNGVEGCEGTLEELKAHYPHLVDFILMELQKAVNWGEDTFGIVSPSLIPILSLCSRISIGMPQLHSESFKKILSEFHVVFLKLLSSPIIMVRKLSAKAISSFTSLVAIPSQISIHINSLDDSMSKNNVHGKLFCISMLNEKFTFNSYLMPTFSQKSIEMNNLIKEIKLTNMDNKTSFFVQSLLYEMQGCDEEGMVNFFGDENKSWFPGMKLKSALTIDSCIMTCPENSVCDIIKKTKHSLDCLEMSLDSLIKRIESSDFSKKTAENITELLIDLFDPSFPPNLLAHFLRSIYLLTKSSSTITISEAKLKSVFIPLLSFSKYGTSCAAEALPFLAFFAIKNLASKKESNVVTDLAMNLKERSSPKHCEEMRKEAGKALIHFSTLFDDTKGRLEEHVEIKACVIHSAVSLLQDENTDVRMEAAICISNLMCVKGISIQQMDFSPQYCLKLIFSNIAQLLPLKDAMEFLWNLLTNEYSLNELMNRRMSTAVCNPFSHGVSNVYAEKVIITSIARKTLFTLIEMNSDAFKITLAKEKKRIIGEAVAINKFLTLHGSEIIQLCATSLRQMKIGEKNEINVSQFRLFISSLRAYREDVALCTDNFRELFTALLDVLASENVLNILHDVGITLQHLSWQVKRKYLILIAVLPKFGIKKALENFPEICEGLVYSLSHPHLVSVGTNLYREVMKGIQFDDWQRFFFHPVKEMLFGSNRTAKENFMSHWMPETLESYSVLLKSLLTGNVNTSLLLPMLSLYKIGRKCDLLSWEEMNRELICNCLHHLDEWIRIEAFSVVCASTKTTVPPTPEEIEMVCTFIEENVNGDNARVRQLMVMSFKNLLTRVRDSYNSSVENKENTVNRKLIMHWIKMFIIDCSKPGSNYQRKITSLYLLRDIFELSREKNHPKRQKVNASIKSFEEKITVDFKSKDMFSLLLESISYPADDVRHLGCSILMENFEPPSDEVLQNLWENALRKCSSSMFYEVECGAVFAELFAHWEIKRHGLNVRDSFDFFEVMLFRAEKQLTETTEDLLRSATEGAIHGTLGILLRMLSNSHIYAKIKVKEDQMRRLLHLLHHLIAHLIGVLSSRKTSNQLYTNLEEYLALVKIKTQLKALIQIESSTEQLSFYLELEKGLPDGGKITTDVDITCTKSF
ncbi:hypothetical protein J437_LFUL017092 [Ladona fulva]|uniref:Uncharacterized protein n=1 Tax=Ladona fulva TaxID=123851 RepID=A0A8K0KQ05_LADFU|nr:hypothetical protein J437_LFUL017092 [Ladona fulva]